MARPFGILRVRRLVGEPDHPQIRMPADVELVEPRDGNQGEESRSSSFDRVVRYGVVWFFRE